MSWHYFTWLMVQRSHDAKEAGAKSMLADSTASAVWTLSGNDAPIALA